MQTRLAGNDIVLFPTDVENPGNFSVETLMKRFIIKSLSRHKVVVFAPLISMSQPEIFKLLRMTKQGDEAGPTTHVVSR